MTTVATATMPITPTPTTTDSLHSTLDQDFRAACVELAQAREQRVHKDTPAHRTAVTAALSTIDVVLDMYLDTRAAR